MNNLAVITSFPCSEQGLELRSRLLNPVNRGTLPQAGKILIVNIDFIQITLQWYYLVLRRDEKIFSYSRPPFPIVCKSSLQHSVKGGCLLSLTKAF